MEGLETIAKDAYLLYSEGFCSNVYILVHGKDVLLIDSGTGETMPMLDKALEGKEITRVILTHGHPDHINGMNYISADALLHKADLKILKQLNSFMPGFKPPNNIYELAFESLKFGAFSLKIIHTPGHTPGSISILDETNKLLFSGDTKFANGGVGRSDLPGGDEKKLKESLKLIASIKYSKLCPGHGPLE